ncbi:MAG: hypothetical protein Q4D77_03930 [Peptostreptococcaceae bacterium]|nr:hypothetical protein [Peptostreptococcaceae bacterium]
MSKFYITTDGNDYREVGWGDLEIELDSMIEHAEDGDFMTIMIGDVDQEDCEFMQFMVNQQAASGGFFGSKKAERSYSLEVRRGDVIYGIRLDDPKDLKEYIGNYYHSKKLPDISDWEVIAEL